MIEVTYLFPNLSSLRQRGGLSSRLDTAQSLGCGYLEVPADFVKNRTEVAKTGLAMGSFLTRGAIAALYDAESGPAPLPYILHTEPSIPRTDGYGMRSQAPLCWYDRAWTEALVEMTVGVAERLNAPPAIVEIHPGDARNRDDDLVRAMIAIRAAFEDRFGVMPAVLLENRTGQFIRDGASIARFWEHLLSAAPELVGDCGIVLDVQQLFTVTRGQLMRNLVEIPPDALKAFHIHALHRAPAMDNPIPWDEVFAVIRRLDHPVLINPEVHHLVQVGPTIQFCREMLGDECDVGGKGPASRRMVVPVGDCRDRITLAGVLDGDPESAGR
ncbi:hypothetical protein [Methanosphaerula subterraneus]|uniref:hypothetical protein n=1 Tax=Methanosphaerula subterraneus TaxID=3350244 RepID=UPI003F87BC9E